MDLNWLVSTISVVSSAAVTITSILVTAKTQRESQKRQHEYEVTIEKLKHANRQTDELRTAQREIISKMASYAMQLENGNSGAREPLYSLALQLLACTSESDKTADCAEYLVSLFKVDQNRVVPGSWTSCVESCARWTNFEAPDAQHPTP